LLEGPLELTFESKEVVVFGGDSAARRQRFLHLVLLALLDLFLAGLLHQPEVILHLNHDGIQLELVLPLNILLIRCKEILLSP